MPAAPTMGAEEGEGLESKSGLSAKKKTSLARGFRKFSWYRHRSVFRLSDIELSKST